VDKNYPVVAYITLIASDVAPIEYELTICCDQTQQLILSFKFFDAVMTIYIESKFISGRKM
jgi:hypothetical protein